jgi:aspartate-semialdehyde dehydrogenase
VVRFVLYNPSSFYYIESFAAFFVDFLAVVLASAVTVGRLRPCNVFDIRFVGLHYNTVRGAAVGAILGAELLIARGYTK